MPKNFFCAALMLISNNPVENSFEITRMMYVFSVKSATRNVKLNELIVIDFTLEEPFLLFFL